MMPCQKGRTYAAVIYGLKDYHMIALLDGKDGITLKDAVCRLSASSVCERIWPGVCYSDGITVIKRDGLKIIHIISFILRKELL